MQRTLAIVMLIAGILGLAYGGFSYTKSTHQADIGSLHLAINETQRFNVPVWGGVGLILVGGLLLAVGRKN